MNGDLLLLCVVVSVCYLYYSLRSNKTTLIRPYHFIESMSQQSLLCRIIYSKFTASTPDNQLNQHSSNKDHTAPLKY